MIQVSTVCYLLFAHMVADFVFQTPSTGRNKSKCIDVLIRHAIIYGVVLMNLLALASVVMPTFSGIPREWSGIGFIYYWWGNTIAHGIVDYFSSKLSKKYHSAGREYAFWKVISIDQLIHTCTIILTFYLIIPL